MRRGRMVPLGFTKPRSKVRPVQINVSDNCLRGHPAYGSLIKYDGAGYYWLDL